jgi:hypothetical protein
VFVVFVFLQGEGRAYHPNGKVFFKGTYSNGRWVTGVEFHANGKKKFEGSWVEGKREGRGSSHFEATGTLEYDGEWKGGKRHGEGVSIFAGPGSVVQYRGHWDEDKKHGQGTLFYAGGFVVGGGVCVIFKCFSVGFGQFHVRGSGFPSGSEVHDPQWVCKVPNGG